MLRKIFLFVALLFLSAAMVQAQVTNSSITGTVLDSRRAPLEGATITVKHEPTGTEFSTVSRKGGQFDLPGLQVGGPYTVNVTYIGQGAKVYDNITLVLGQSYSITSILSDEEVVLEGVVVTGTAKKGSTSLKTGVGTAISSKQLRTAPSINRTINDFIRFTPQSNGTSFAGRDGRYNNLQVDGANLNNNFGLTSELAPGGGSPISLDALEEISVNIAPYDVRQSGFTGAGINVVTKSGSNQFHGSAYGYMRNSNFYGYNVNGTKLTKTDNSNSVVGFNIGGPIIKNKLFFFVNYEKEKSSVPGITFTPSGSNITGQPSATTVADLKKVYDFVKQKYGYDLGAYENFPNFEESNRKFLAKLDWVINSKHKLTVKYTDYEGFSGSPLNGSSVPQNGRIFVTGQNNGVTRLPSGRFSANSMAFNSSNYGTHRLVKSATLELNSRFSNQISNQFLATLTKSNDIRTPFGGGGIFPTVDIFNGSGQNYISLGTDPFTNNNQLVNDVLSFTDNLTCYLNRHKITGGINVEHQKVGNMFMAGSQGHYVFNSLDDFLQEKAPAYYGYTYSLVPGQKAVFSAELNMIQAGIYLQDEYSINDRLKVTYGVRADVPIYGTAPIANPKIDELTFPDKDGKMIKYTTGSWPKNTPLISPRIGINYDVLGDKSLTLRGGTGIFSGRIPLVFLTNMPSNSGMYQNAVFLNTPAALANAGITKFDPNPDAYANSSAFSITAGQKVPQNFVLIDPDFKFPQVWRSSIGADYRFGDGFTATIDAMYTKDLNAVVMRNPNLKAPTGTLTGPDNRKYYPKGTSDINNALNADANYYTNSSVGTPIVLENTKKGFSYNITAQLSKSFRSGFFIMAAYTYSRAKEISPNPGNRATSAWQSIANVNGANDQVLDFSQYAIPHRIIGNISYTTQNGIFGFPSSFSLFYEGAVQGMLNYNIYGSIVGDGNTQLMYVYAKGCDVPFVATSKYTVAQQQAAYNEFIANSKYLSSKKGSYVNRYGASLPWFNQIDFKYLQDVLVRKDESGKVINSLQLSLDILNIGNMISSKTKGWGYKETTTITDPLVFKGVANDTPTFSMREFNGALATNPYQQLNTTSGTWRMQLGLRFNF